MAYAPRTEEEAEQESREVAKPDRTSRVEACITLRMYGTPFSDIAKELGYATASQARLAYEKGLAAQAGPEEREHLRYIEGRRLERLLRAVMPQATDENNPEQVAYVRASLSIIDRHARLFGLDAPQEMVLYNPTAVELEQWLASKTALTQQGFPEEANIIEGVVIDSDIGDDE